MNSNNFLNIVRRPKISSPPLKKKLRGSIYVAPVEKASQKDWQLRAPASPSTLDPVAPDFNKIDSILNSVINSGDVASSSSLSAFVVNPTTKAVIIVIDSIGSYRGIDKTQILLHYLTLAKSESNFKTGEGNTNSTARGQIQLLKGTYREMMPKGERLIQQLPSWIDKSIRAMFTDEQLQGDRWMVNNHDDPARDISQYVAVVGQIYSLLDRVLREWKYDGIRWLPRISTPSTNSFASKYDALLRPQGSGRQVLMTAYHVWGLYHFASHKNSVVFPYPGRLTKDAKIFTKLASIQGLYNTMRTVAFASVDTRTSTKMIGDVYVPGNLTISDNVDAINSYIARKLAINHSLSPTGSAIVTSHYGKRNVKGGSKMHEGIDLRARVVGLPVFAVDNGTIVRVEQKGKYGKFIILRCDDDSGFRYAHLSKVFVTPSMKVLAGQMIGLSGKSGTSVPHLHFEYFPDASKSTNPEVEINPLDDPKQRWKNAVNSK